MTTEDTQRVDGRCTSTYNGSATDNVFVTVTPSIFLVVMRPVSKVGRKSQFSYTLSTGLYNRLGLPPNLCVASFDLSDSSNEICVNAAFADASYMTNVSCAEDSLKYNTSCFKKRNKAYFLRQRHYHFPFHFLSSSPFLSPFPPKPLPGSWPSPPKPLPWP